MLVLTRKEGESLYIGDDVRITIISADSEKVRIGIEAPKYRRIFREELLTDTKTENQMAVQSAYSEIPVPELLKRNIKKDS
jgi:carbon storage regulator